MSFNKIISPIIAVGSYLVIVFAVLYYFNYKSQHKTIVMVEKNTNKISVSLASSKNTKDLKTTVKKPPKEKEAPKTPIEKKNLEAEPKKEPKQKPKKVNKIRNNKSTKPAKPIPKKILPKKKPKKPKKPSKPKKPPKPKKPSKPKKPTRKKSTTRTNRAVKKVNTSQLFGSVKTTKAKASRPAKKSASEMVSESLKKNNNDAKGVENAYLSKVSKKLKGFPSQVNYAGEELEVHLTIYSNGTFKYRIVTPSGNQEMNEVILSYLKQLQGIGFGPHNRATPYEKTFIIKAKGG